MKLITRCLECSALSTEVKRSKFTSQKEKNVVTLQLLNEFESYVDNELFCVDSIYSALSKAEKCKHFDNSDHIKNIILKNIKSNIKTPNKIDNSKKSPKKTIKQLIPKDY